MNIGNETQKNLDSVSFSGKILAHYPLLIKALLSVKKAAAITNQACGHLSQLEAQQILLALEYEDWDLAQRASLFPVDVFGGGGSIGIHFNIAEYVSIKSGISVARINQSQSTADVSHTAFRITIIKTWQILDTELEKIVTSFEKKCEDFIAINTLARTCLQDAGIISLSQSLSAFPAALTRRATALKHSVLKLQQLNLGGTVYGNGANASDSYRTLIMKNLSSCADLSLSHRSNLVDAAQNSDDLGEVSAQLAQLALVLMKIARDLRLLASGPRGGFGELILPKSQEGSSFYRNKINPIIPETILQCGFLILGADRTAQSALEHAELQLNVFDNSIAITILDAMSWLTKALSNFNSLAVMGMKANPIRCQELTSFATPNKN